MASNAYINAKNRSTVVKTTNVVDLINRSELERKKEKRQNLVIAAIAVSALAASSFLISF